LLKFPQFRNNIGDETLYFLCIFVAGTEKLTYVTKSVESFILSELGVITSVRLLV